MVGPILRQELLIGSRRHRLHVFRWVYAGWLATAVFYFFLLYLSEEATIAQARILSGGEVRLTHASPVEIVGARFSNWFVWQQTLFVFLAVPIFTASSVAEEKRRGTLQHLALTEVEGRHIIVGKVIARVILVSLWLLAGLPVFALLAGFGGVEPITLLFLACGTLLPVYGVAAASILLSVICRETRDAVVAVYSLLLLIGATVLFVGRELRYLDPLWVLEPSWGTPGTIDTPLALSRLITATLIWGGLGTLCLVVAILRLWPAIRSEIEQVGLTRTRWYSQEREPIEEPISWREQHVEGLAPNATLRRIPRWLGITLVTALGTISSMAILNYSLAQGASWTDLVEALLQLNVRQVTVLVPAASIGFGWQGIGVMVLASLVVGVRCAGAITQERENHTWEAILLTPMSARQIVLGKLWGIIGAASWYLLAYAAPAITLSVLAGPLALTLTLAWLGATFLAMYFIGAAGVWCSVRSSGSWRSLLQTMGVGYVGGLLAYAVCTPALAAVFLLFLVVLLFIDLPLGTGLPGLCLRNMAYFARLLSLSSATMLVVLFWLLAKLFLARTQRWIADRERTRFWQKSPRYRRSRHSEDQAAVE